MGRASLTVVTATIPGREDALARAMRSVYEQTVEVEAHLIMAQSCTEGLAPPLHVSQQRNALLPSITTDYIAFLNDDDEWLPNHVETVQREFGQAKVIYTWDAGGSRPRLNCNEWSQAHLQRTLEGGNFIDSNAVVNTRALRLVGGWPELDDYPTRFRHSEDWELWYRMAGWGFKFRCIPIETWRYHEDRDDRSSNMDWRTA